MGCNHSGSTLKIKTVPSYKILASKANIWLAAPQKNTIGVIQKRCWVASHAPLLLLAGIGMDGSGHDEAPVWLHRHFPAGVIHCEGPDLFRRHQSYTNVKHND